MIELDVNLIINMVCDGFATILLLIMSNMLYKRIRAGFEGSSYGKLWLILFYSFGYGIVVALYLRQLIIALMFALLLIVLIIRELNNDNGGDIHIDID